MEENLPIDLKSMLSIQYEKSVKINHFLKSIKSINLRNSKFSFKGLFKVIYIVMHVSNNRVAGTKSRSRISK